MSELIDHEIICNECKHKNIFRVKGETMTLITGQTITYRTEALGERICEGCGRVLKA